MAIGKPVKIAWLFMHDVYDGMKVYRALVSYAASTTGEIQVKIPSILGSGASISISKIGRKPSGGSWPVPTVGDQVLVAVEDDRFSNVYIIYPQTSIS
jgi:hypothetical protein